MFTDSTKNNTWIYIVPCGQRPWRQVGSVFRESVSEYKKFLKPRFKKRQNRYIRTVCGSEFQRRCWKSEARLEKSVLVNGWTSSGMSNEHEIRLQTRSMIWQVNWSGRAPNFVCQNLQLVCDPLPDWQTTSFAVYLHRSWQWGCVLVVARWSQWLTYEVIHCHILSQLFTSSKTTQVENCLFAAC